MSIGFTSWNVAVYSTMPRALRGASLMSWMMALCGSFGSSSPKARPASVSYWPALPKLAPSKAGETFVSMTILVTRACAATANGRQQRAGGEHRNRLGHNLAQSCSSANHEHLPVCPP